MTMTEIHPGDPVRSVELRESAWNTILEATQYIQLGSVSNVVRVIKEQLREPITTPTDDHPGYTVQSNEMSSNGDVYPQAGDVHVDDGILTITDRAGNTIAIYALGRWDNVAMTRKTDDEPATS